jgi:hypothetical protein
MSCTTTNDNNVNTNEDIDKAIDYMKNNMTQKDLDDIDTECDEYKKFYIKRELSIRSNLIWPITNVELEIRIKTQYHLIKMGFNI